MPNSSIVRGNSGRCICLSVAVGGLRNLSGMVRDISGGGGGVVCFGGRVVISMSEGMLVAWDAVVGVCGVLGFALERFRRLGMMWHVVCLGMGGLEGVMLREEIMEVGVILLGI